MQKIEGSLVGSRNSGKSRTGRTWLLVGGAGGAERMVAWRTVVRESGGAEDR